MDGIKILRRESYHSLPWKNGLGVTREILRHPTGAEDFAWRLSLADVGQSGPFSAFPGYERVIVLLKGDGFVLRFGNGEEHALRNKYEPFRFDGGREVTCVLDGGASNDLNLMVRADLGPANCEVLRLDGETVLTAGPGRNRLLFCLENTIEIRGEKFENRSRSLTLNSWDTAVTDGECGVICASRGPSRVFHALVSSVSEAPA